MGTHSETILLVDDEPMVLKLVSAILRRYGYEVREAESGRAALDRYSQDPKGVDLLITDIEMPEMRGPELVKELGKRGCRVPVIYISGYYDEESFRQLTNDAEGLEFLPKPLYPRLLAMKVRALLDEASRPQKAKRAAGSSAA